MLDWEEIALSDPMRDVGLFLWWYVPPHKWREFFEVYDHTAPEPGDPTHDGIYWWAARRSLEVALWLDRHDHKSAAQVFLTDFIAAAHRSGNPKLRV
jgi:hypothetical protein